MELTSPTRRIKISCLQTGDVLLCQSSTLIGRIIRFWTKKYRSDIGYCHCAMIISQSDCIDNFFVAEIYNFSGGRIVPIREFLKEYNDGEVDAYYCPGINRQETANKMLSIIFTKYSFITIIRNAVERFFRSKKSFDDNEPLNLKQGLTCATAVAFSLKEGGGVDPCLFLRTASVTPADFGRSPRLKKLFTI